MKRLIYKLPLAGATIFGMLGCANNQSADERFYVQDTVVVLNYVNPSMQSGRKIWVADKAGREMYSNNVSLGPKPAVAPVAGDEIVIERGVNTLGVPYMMVLENLTAQKIKQEYVQSR